MATTSSNPTVTGTPVSNPNNESPATLQRKLIVLAFNLPDNIVTTSPIEDQITVTVDSVDTATFTNPDGTTNTDYLVIVKVVQNLSYCTRSLVGACKILEGEDEYNSYKSSSRLSKSEEMDYNFHLAKVCCILCDYFKTEGLNPESYLNEVTRYKREER